MVIGVIDDGVDTNTYDEIQELVWNVEVNDDLLVTSIVDKENQPIKSHGTLCAAIIKKYAPLSQIASVKVLNSSMTTSPEKIIKALEWCISKGIRIFNISIGGINMINRMKFHPIISHMLKQNCFIVVAMSNSTKYSVLTDFMGVISVERNKNLNNNEYSICNKFYFSPDFCASSCHTLKKVSGELVTICSQNSHAAPTICARVHNLLIQNPHLTVNQTKLQLALKNKLNNLLFVKLLPDFIDSAVTIGSPIYNFPLAFDIKKQFIKIEDFRLMENEYVVIFPDNKQNEKTLYNKLLRYKDNISGLLFAGIAPNWLKQYCYNVGCLFWDESEYISYIKKTPIEKEKLSIPTISIYGDTEEALFFSNRFNNYLLNQGYFSIICSDITQSYCYNSIFLSSKFNYNNLINSLAVYYNLSTVIFCLESLDIHTDVSICLLNDKITVIDERNEKYTLSQEGASVDLCFSNILDILCFK